jgi:G:T/U-mismatch repair DNA glycosylase
MQHDLQLLFVGTFNPAWDGGNKNNAAWFYGRDTNLFWCILPHALYENCLIDKGIDEWQAFCQERRIGLTDIISCINNADEGNQEHRKALTKGFPDDKLDDATNGEYVFDLAFTTDLIKDMINSNRATMKGVFFTRSTHKDVPRIWKQWLEIATFCAAAGITTQVLPSPSPRGGSIRGKINTWRREISQALEK